MAEQEFESTLCDIKVFLCCVAFLCGVCGVGDGAGKELERRGM